MVSPAVQSVAQPAPMVPVLLLELQPAEVLPGGGRRSAELAGLVTALAELGLADIHGVRTRVGACAPSPGLEEPVLTGAEQWFAELAIEGTAQGFDLALTLCPDEGSCSDHRGQGGTLDRPEPAVAAVLQSVASELVRPMDLGAVEAWGAPQSEDPYAVLVAGRAAGSWYLTCGEGPVARKDVDRAVFIDPSMPVAAWLAGRLAFQRGEVVEARQWLARALMARPDTALLTLGAARAWEAEDKPHAAHAVLGWPDPTAVRDPRAAILLLRSLLDAGELDGAQAVFDALTPAVRAERVVAALGVTLSEARGSGLDYDALLATWQEAAPEDPEPVRRRLAVRIRGQRLDEALELVPTLRERGAVQEAGEVELALRASLGQWEGAAAAARALGDETTARRIEARVALEQPGGPGTVSLEGDPLPAALVVLGERALTDGDPAAALALARRGGQDPDALRLAARALREMGRAGEADQAFAAARRVYPAGLTE